MVLHATFGLLPFEVGFLSLDVGQKYRIYGYIGTLFMSRSIPMSSIAGPIVKAAAAVKRGERSVVHGL